LIWGGTLFFPLLAAMARLAASHNWMFRQAAAAYLKPPSHSSGFPPIGLNHRSASFLYSTQFMYSGKSIEDSELWVLQVFQWVPHFTPFWPTPSKLCFFFLSSSSLLAFILQTTLLCQTHHCMENLQVPVMDLCGHGSVQKMEMSTCSVLQQFTHWPEILTPELQPLAVKC
jgi:hypothetical protein